MTFSLLAGTPDIPVRPILPVTPRLPTQNVLDLILLINACTLTSIHRLVSSNTNLMQRSLLLNK